VEFRWYSPSWDESNASKREALGILDTQEDAHPTHTDTDRKAEMYDEWHADYTAIPHHKPYHQSCTPPDSNRPPPFIRGALSRGARRLYTAAIQLTTGHAFTSTYSKRFRPTAGDNTACPCSRHQPPGVAHGTARHHSLHQSQGATPYRLRHHPTLLGPHFHHVPRRLPTSRVPLPDPRASLPSPT
jgi:hypothetical protein